jgi:hypothetical protein
VRAQKTRSDAALPSARARHRPFAQSNFGLGLAGQDHDPIGGGPGKLRVEGVGKVLRPRERDATELRDHAGRQSQAFADEAMV